jgi:serpin B
MHLQEVIVYLPKFKMTWGTFELNKSLIALGMPYAFDVPPNTADFSGMNGNKDLSIAYVFHKAFVEVNEEGTEAAAATAVIMTLKSAPHSSPVFHADHPFLFVIRDNRSGSILFMGRVMNPTMQ